MQSGDIRDGQITASSSSGHHPDFQAWRGRLSVERNGAWVIAHPTDSWIQVDLLRSTVVTGIITQGYGFEYEDYEPEEYWIRSLQIQLGNSEDTLVYILEDGQPKV